MGPVQNDVAILPSQEFHLKSIDMENVLVLKWHRVYLTDP